VASEREVRMLIAQLEASLQETGGLELDVAIAEHRRLVARTRRLRARGERRPLPDAADPRGEIIARRLRVPRVRRALALASS
jgi:hypothetical protein